VRGQSSESAVAAWIVCLLGIFLYVLAYDLWAHYTEHRTMTNQFRVWMTQPVMGPLIVGLYAGLFIGLTYHFWVRGK
jgi:hypothetical protein